MVSFSVIFAGQVDSIATHIAPGEVSQSPQEDGGGQRDMRTHLLLAINVGVQQTDNELKVRLFAADERHAGQQVRGRMLRGFAVAEVFAKSWSGGLFWVVEILVVNGN